MSQVRYKAFISYSHHDARWAKWLHRNLESYRPPKQLRNSGSLKPIFRDRDELAASNDLTASIVAALNAAENLIVICSASAAKSRWVNEEVKRFAGLGRADRIFCLFVEDPTKTECLPEALRDTQPLGADLRPEGDGRRGAKLKIIAGMMNVGFDSLRQRDARRRRARLVNYSLGVLASLGAASFVTYRVATEPPCSNSRDLFAGVWNEGRAEQIQTRFISAGLPFGEHTGKAVLDTLSRYANQWVDVHQQACEATVVKGEQSEALMDLRMACLVERKGRFDALAGQFVLGDAETVSNAIHATQGLGQLSRCSDRAALLSAYPPPEGADVQAVEAGRAHVAELRAVVDSGQATRALSLAQEAWERVEPTGYPPLQAETLVLLGKAQAMNGQAAEAKSTFLQGASKAVLARDNALAAQAWLSVPALVREKVRGADEARDMLALADAYVEQLPPDHPLRAKYHADLGEVLVVQGKLSEGVAALEVAIALSRAGSFPRLSIYLSKLARVHASHLELRSALPLAEEALAMSELDFGKSHPAYAESLKSMAAVYHDGGEHARAVPFARSALELEERVYPSPHPTIAGTYELLGAILVRDVKFEEAEAALTRSLAMYAQLDDPSPIELGDVHNALGNLYSLMEKFAAAERHLSEAARLWESVAFYRYSIVLNNLGSMLMGTGDYEAARDYCERALVADEAQYPPDNPNIAYPLSCLGETLVELGRFDEAVSRLRRAYDIRRRRYDAPLPMAHTRIVLAMALWEVGGDLGEIRSHYDYALATVIEHDTGDEAALRQWAEGKNF
jgi:tetratricopeptide (TPR) repeat protein